MACALGLQLVSSLLALASLDLELGVRAEGRSTTVSSSGIPDDTRASYSTVPRATLRAEASALRLTAAYAPRFWESDVAAQTSPLVEHTLSARVETNAERAWRAEATATASRGTTDPLAEPWQAAAVAAGRQQVATTRPLGYESLRTGAAADVRLGPRSTANAAVAWDVTRSTEPEDRVFLPLQRTLTADGGLTRLASERDTVRLLARQLQVWTDAPGGTARTATSTASGSWRRRMTIHLDAWAGAGATYATFDSDASDAEPSTADLLPNAEVGIARTGEGLVVTGDATARLTTFVDGFTGEVRPLAEAIGAVQWRPVPRVTLGSSAVGGASTDGETTLARAALHATWSPRDRVSVDLGVSGRLQRERRPELPSFDEGGSFASLAWTLRERLTLQLGAMARTHRERTRPDASFREAAVFAGVAYATDRLFGSVE